MFNQWLDTEIGELVDAGGVVDQQVGPTCGYEAVENVIQLFGHANDALSDGLLPYRASLYGCAWSDGSLDVAGYQPLLREWGIQGRWCAFDHRLLIHALTNHRTAIAVVDPHLLDAQFYPSIGELHAVVVANLGLWAGTKYVTHYLVLDSNRPRQELFIPSSVLERAVRNVPYTPLLVTIQPRPLHLRRGAFTIQDTTIRSVFRFVG